MGNRGRNALIGLIAGLPFWAATAIMSDVREPWDAPGYGFTYLIGLAICMLLGALLGRGAAWAGAAFVFAQFPVMLAMSGIGSLIVAGLFLLSVMSIPGALAAAVGSRFS